MSGPRIDRDERTVSVENAGYRLTYLFLCFGLLAAIMVRSFRDGESAWDLFALILLSGALHRAYLRHHHATYRRSVAVGVIAMVLGALTAIAAALFHHRPT